MPFVGQIIMFAGNFAPPGWALCDGQLLPISRSTSLFSILGTTHGGDGRTTFGLPDLRGRVPIHEGAPFTLGQKGGQPQVSLTEANLPPHTHTLGARDDVPQSDATSNTYLARSVAAGGYTASNPANSALRSDSITNTGGSQPHNNLQPYATINYIIALFGDGPAR